MLSRSVSTRSNEPPAVKIYPTIGAQGFGPVCSGDSTSPALSYKNGQQTCRELDRRPTATQRGKTYLIPMASISRVTSSGNTS